MRYLWALHLPMGMVILFTVIKLYPIALIYVFDCYKRTKEYIKVSTSTPSERLYNLYKGTYCQRSVVKAIHKDSEQYYYSLGYRFYHVLPDAWVRDPRSIVSIKWWKGFFFS